MEKRAIRYPEMGCFNERLEYWKRHGLSWHTEPEVDRKGQRSLISRIERDANKQLHEAHDLHKQVLRAENNMRKAYQYVRRMRKQAREDAIQVKAREAFEKACEAYYQINQIYVETLSRVDATYLIAVGANRQLAVAVQNQG